MKTFIIFDATRVGNHEPIAEINAGNGKTALRKFQQNHCMNAGIYEIRRTKKSCWEMSSTYGSYFYAIKKEEQDMKIYLVDKQKYFRVTFEEARRILASGLMPNEWTRANIQPYLMY